MHISNQVAPPPTLGESRVRVKFNVVEQKAARSNVDEIKRESARLIDFCAEGITDVNMKDWNQNAKNEANRLWEKAQENYELAAMLAVKAATYGI